MEFNQQIFISFVSQLTTRNHWHCFCVIHVYVAVSKTKITELTEHKENHDI